MLFWYTLCCFSGAGYLPIWYVVCLSVVSLYNLCCFSGVLWCFCIIWDGSPNLRGVSVWFVLFVWCFVVSHYNPLWLSYTIISVYFFVLFSWCYVVPFYNLFSHTVWLPCIIAYNISITTFPQQTQDICITFVQRGPTSSTYSCKCF